MSGAEVALSRLLPALQEVDPVVILAEHGPLVQILEDNAIDVRILPIPEHVRGLRRDQVALSVDPLLTAGSATRAVLQLALVLRQLAPDLVVTNSLKSALYGGVAARLARIPVVWHLHDRISPDYLPATAIALIRALARTVPAGIIANSETTLSSLPRRGIKNTAVIGNALPASIPPRSPAAPGPLKVGLVGRLSPWKGQAVFLRAVAESLHRGADIHALVVGASLFPGDDDYAASLDALVHELDITDHVTFTGFVNDPLALMASFDILVHASTIPEPFGQVVVEGMAVGCPVVASGAGGPAELVEHGTNGLLFRPGDHQALAAALLRLSCDPDLRRRLAGRGLRTAARFTPELVAAEEGAFYRRVLHRRSAIRSRSPEP